MTAPADSRISDERLDEGTVLRLVVRHFHASKTRSALTYEQWKDGIDITRVGTEMMNFCEALITELRERRAQAVTVKPLEWIERVASTPVGDYWIVPRFDGTWTLSSNVWGPEDNRRQCTTEEVAMTLASTDYERRVLSVLAAPPPAQAASETALQKAAQMAGNAFWSLPMPAHWDRDKDAYSDWCATQSKRIREGILALAGAPPAAGVTVTDEGIERAHDAYYAYPMGTPWGVKMRAAIEAAFSLSAQDREE